MFPVSLGPASVESIKITECLQGQIESNRLFLTVMTKHRYRGKQRFFLFLFFSRIGQMRERIDPCKAILLRGNIPKVYLYVTLFSFPPSLFLCLLSKTTWANTASCHIKAIPCILQQGEFCSWMERHTHRNPTTVYTRGVKTARKKSLLSEPELVP